MAGFFGFFNYDKPGKGVDENAPPKRRIIMFFELYFRKFTKLIQLNLLYFLVSIPGIVIMFFISNLVLTPVFERISATPEVYGEAMPVEIMLMLSLALTTSIICLWGGGPVTAGFTYIIRNFTREEHTWIWSDFWEHTKKNFKQAILVFLIDILVIYMLYISYNFYRTTSGFMSYFQYLMIFLLIIYTMMHMYIYPMMVTFKLSLKNLYRNSFLFAFAKLPMNILLILLVLAIIYICFNFYPLVIIISAPLLLISTCGYITIFWSYPMLQKYMIIEKDEVKPEE